MNCLIIGYGSIGHRHASILRELGHEIHVVSESSTKDFPFYHSISAALAEKYFDYIIVSCETSEHYGCYIELVNRGYSGKVLIEKPVFSELPATIPPASKNVFIGYNLRFHPAVKKLRELFFRKRLYSVHVYAGQYLPGWRPDGDYSKSYLASRAKGGGVLKDLSHELDYITWMAGDWKRVAAIGGRFSHLEIDSDDIFSLLMETENCPVVSIQLNYLDLIARREIIIQAKGMSVKADLIGNTLDVNGEITRYSSERNLSYTVQHREILEGSRSDACTFTEGINILKLIHAAEEASKCGTWVQRRID